VMVRIIADNNNRAVVAPIGIKIRATIALSHSSNPVIAGIDCYL
jgi:hypothetical protein